MPLASPPSSPTSHSSAGCPRRMPLLRLETSSDDFPLNSSILCLVAHRRLGGTTLRIDDAAVSSASWPYLLVDPLIGCSSPSSRQHLRLQRFDFGLRLPVTYTHPISHKPSVSRQRFFRASSGALRPSRSSIELSTLPVGHSLIILLQALVHEDRAHSLPKNRIPEENT